MFESHKTVGGTAGSRSDAGEGVWTSDGLVHLILNFLGLGKGKIFYSL